MAEEWIVNHNLNDNLRLGQNLAVVAGWELAVETVLGNFLSAVQVENIAEFGDSLAQLPDGELALVDGTAYSHTSDNTEQAGVADLPPLQSLIRSDGSVTSSLLHNVFAAQSTEVALANRGRLSAGQSIITREGFWVGPDWIKVIHTEDEQSGIIERGQEIETLNLRVEEAERTLGELLTHVQEGKNRVQNLEQQRQTLQQSVTQLTENLGKRRTDHGVTQVKIEEAGARREQLDKESRDIAGQIENEQLKLDDARTLLVQAEFKVKGQEL